MFDDSKIWQVAVAIFGFILTSIGYVWRKMDKKIEDNTETINTHQCHLAVFSERLDHQDKKLDEIANSNKVIIKMLSSRVRKP